MIMLDANAFYWYLGRDKLRMESSQFVDRNKLCAFLDSTSEKCIPATVYMEIITHFRDDPPRLKLITSFIIEKEFKIFNNYPGCSISTEEMRGITYMPEGLLSSYAYTKLSKKIQIEAELSAIFLEIVRVLYSYYCIEKVSSFTSEEAEKLLLLIGRQGVNQGQNKHVNVFKTALSKGYGNKEEEKILKNTYIDLLTEECISINLFIEAAIQVKNESENIVNALQGKFLELQTNGFNLGSVQNAAMRNIVTEMSADSGFLVYSTQRISDIFKNKGFLPHQCEYIKDIMLPAWLVRGQKIRKNDIFDMLCVGSLDVNFVGGNLQLISFDGTMKTFLASHSLPSYSLGKHFE